MDQDYQQVPDETLARETQGGSLVAFEELVYRYEGRIYSFVSQTCRNAMDAREITQDTFVKAYTAIAQFDPGRPFASWLFTIARRKTIDHFRSARPASQDPVPELADPKTPADALEQSEEHTRVWEQVRHLLPQLQFQVVWLKYVEEMSVAEIAKVLRKTQVYIKVLLFRARQTLARHLRTDRQDSLQVGQGGLLCDTQVLKPSTGTLDLCLPKRKGIL